MSSVSDSSLDSEDDPSSTETEEDSDSDSDEVDSDPSPVILEPVSFQANVPGQPAQFDVKSGKHSYSSSLPLCMMLNARSVYNKVDRLKTMLREICPEITIVSETWERKRINLNTLLDSDQFKSISYARPKRPGGGCAIIYNDARFEVTELKMDIPDGVEAAYALLVPRNKDKSVRVKQIVVGSFYTSPNSRHKSATIEHIIESIHLLRAKFDNEVNFILGGDFNRLPISEIMDAYGALNQLVSVPTRLGATLEIILTDLHSLYHPPTTLPPLEVDQDKDGADSDHNIVIMAPLSNGNYELKRKKKTIVTRPLPTSNFAKFEAALQSHSWVEVIETEDVDQKVQNLHGFIRKKKWMTPELKQLHRRVQREFFKSRQSAKWRKLKKSFKKLKKKSVRSFHTKFVNEMKISDPGKWYRLAKKIGAVGQNNDGDIKVESLTEMTNEQAVEEIASHFSSIANEYNPLDTCQLPAYQPTLPPPKVNELAVYKRIEKLKNTRSTLPLDLPNKLRKEFAVELAEPLTNIINESLIQQKYPTLWKFEWVTPVPKITHPKIIKDLRKISSTSDFSKVYESFLKDWIMEDISQKIDIGQFGGQKGLGTEHLIVCLVDRILKLLDDNQEMSAVIAALVDWSAAFDRQDPTLAIKNFLNIGVRPSLIPVLVSYLKDRKMKVKFNGEESKEHSLNGGGPQGTLLGGIEYLINSNNNANSVEPEDRFKYVDDLSILHLIMMSGLLMNYDFRSHVASDIEVDKPFLPPATYGTQTSLDKIADWTEANMMKFNHDKSNYIVFSRSHDKFSTRLNLENVHLDRVKMTKVLGVWLTEDLKWAKNTKEICIKAYSRVSMLTK